jgi:hypothetical protein
MGGAATVIRIQLPKVSTMQATTIERDATGAAPELGQRRKSDAAPRIHLTATDVACASPSRRRSSIRPLRVALAAISLAVLAACGGGGGGSVAAGGDTSSPATGAISGTVTKGPMSNATVIAYGVNSGQLGAQIGTATTDASGNFSLVVGNYAGPVMLQVSGGTYIDEATGATVTMAPGDVITAVMPNMAAGTTLNGIQVTPVTAMAQAMASHMAGGMTDANIAAASKAMGQYFAISDILHVPPMNPLVAGSGTGASVDSQNYGMTMAAMSKYAQTLGLSSSSAIVTAMMNDASDGVLNGLAGSVPVQMGGMGGGMMMPSNAGSAGIGAAMYAFMNSAQNRSGVITMPLMNWLNGAGGQNLGGGQVTGGATLSGTVFDGAVSRATVMAFAISNGAVGAQIAGVVTDGQGTFTLQLGSYTGPVILRVGGDVFVDEATGTIQTTMMGGGNVMSAVLPTVAAGATVTGLWVTPVTSMAQARALGLSGGLTDANIAAANKAVGDCFLVTDILHVQPINPTVAGAAAGASQDAKNYGMTVAAMSQYAKTLNLANSSAIVTALAQDAYDGVMDGKYGTNQIAISTYGGMMGGGAAMDPSAGTSGLATAMTAFTSSAANASGVKAADMAALMQKLASSDGHL